MEDIDKNIIQKEFEGKKNNCNFILGFHMIKKYKTVFVLDSSQQIEHADKVVNQKVFNFLDKDNIIDFIREYI